jgi:hypothetical protein
VGNKAGVRRGKGPFAAKEAFEAKATGIELIAMAMLSMVERDIATCFNDVPDPFLRISKPSLNEMDLVRVQGPAPFQGQRPQGSSTVTVTT